MPASIVQTHHHVQRCIVLYALHILSCIFQILTIKCVVCLCRSWYFCLHLLCLLLVVALPVKSRRRQVKEPAGVPQKDSPQERTEHNDTDNNCNQKDKATWGFGQQCRSNFSSKTRNHWQLECCSSIYPTKIQISDALKIPTGRKHESMSCPNFQ